MLVEFQNTKIDDYTWVQGKTKMQNMSYNSVVLGRVW